MEFKEIRKLLEDRVDEVVTKLFPSAKKKGNRYHVGSIDGEPGESLVIEGPGEKVGLWMDGATDDRGNIVWLFVKKFGGAGPGFRQAKQFLGIDDSKWESNTRTWDKPKREWKKGKPSDPVLSYLKSRGIKTNVLRDYNIKSSVKWFSGAEKELECYVFPYYDEDQGLCNVKYVALQRDDKGRKFEASARNGKHSLFGINKSNEFLRNTGKLSIVICEGELDALSVVQSGFFGVSVPYGCGTTHWIDCCYESLSFFETIYILFDGDDRGREAVKNICGRIGIERVKIVKLPEGVKDANELINLPDGEETLKQCIENAKNVEHDKVADPTKVVDLVMRSFSVGKPEDQGDEWCGWSGEKCLHWKVRPAEITIHCGYPGGAKTTNLLQGMAYFTLVKGHKCAIASTEVEPYTLIQTMAYQAIGKKMDRNNPDDVRLFKSVAEILMRNIYLYDFRGIAKIDDIMDFARYCCKVKGVNHFVLDSLTNSDVDLEDGKSSADFINKAVGFTVETGVHFHLVAHLRKGDQMDIRYIPRFDAIKGSNVFGALTSNCITWWRNYVKEKHMKLFHYDGPNASRNELGDVVDKDGKTMEQRDRMWGDSIALVSKQKVGGVVGERRLWYSADCYSFRADRAIKDSYINVKDGVAFPEYDEPF